jgi:hypothetical protein
VFLFFTDADNITDYFATESTHYYINRPNLPEILLEQLFNDFHGTVHKIM